MTQKTSTRDRILDEALILFAQRGFEATSVHDIAANVGIKAPSLYKHFAGKQAIFDAIVERAVAEHLAAAGRLGAPKVGENAAERYGRADRETMVRITTGLLQHWTAGNAALFRRMLSAERLRSPQMAKLYRELFLDGPHAYQTALFAQMIEDGAFRPANPAQLALQFWAPILFLMERSDCNVDPQELEAQAQTHILSFMDQEKAGEDHPAPRATGRSAEDHPAPRATGRSAEDHPAPRATGRSAEDGPAPRATDHSAEDGPAPRATGRSAEDRPAPRATDRNHANQAINHDRANQNLTTQGGNHD